MSSPKEMNRMATDRADLVKAVLPPVPETVRPPAEPAHDILATPPDSRDITAELSAPPRRRMPWLTLCLAAGIVAAAAFSGGVWYERDHGNGNGGGRSPVAGGGFGQRAGGASGYGQRNGAGFGQGQGAGQGQGGGSSTTMTTGTVKVVDGRNLYLTDAQGNIVKITTGGGTKVKLSKDGKVSDLQPGDTVVVQGTQDSSGNVAASQVTEGGGTLGGLGGFGRFAGGFGGGQAGTGAGAGAGNGG